MKNLTPKFILHNFANKKYTGKTKAFSMFIDIAGFTALTDYMMENGKEGSEVLIDIINKVFTPAIEAIEDNNGFVSTFGGDSFYAIFDQNNKFSGRGCINAALTIRNLFDKIDTQQTKFGDFQLSVKIGISFGNLDWGIIQNINQNAYYFKGESINNCSKCEKLCNNSEIIFDENFLNSINQKDIIINYSVKTSTFYKLINKNFTETNIKKLNYQLDNKIENSFMPKTILQLKAKGEFRNVISCFISFEEKNNWEENISAVADLVHEFGGYFNRINFGDKGGFLLVFFGAPVAQEMLFSRAVNFSLAVNNIRNFSTRIGLTFGVAFAGFIGSNNRHEYTCQSKNVNLAARFMTKATFGQIYINDTIFHKIHNSYKIQSLEKINFKGFTEKVKVHLLLKKELISADTFYNTKLVGRKTELKKLQDAINPIFENRFAGIIFVDGIAGIGKSRLIGELKANINNSKTNSSVNWFYMPCDAILQNSFNPIKHFLKNYFDQSPDFEMVQNKSTFESVLENLLNKTTNIEIKKELIRTKQLLGSMINLVWEDSFFDQLSAKIKFENLLSALKNLIKAESLQKPVIIELEDGHWIDSDSRKFIQELSMNIENYPITIISACRFNDDRTLIDFELKDSISTRISLNSFSKKGTANLLQKNFYHTNSFTQLETKTNTEIPKSTLNLIYEKSEGNPFYIEQIALYLNENKMLDNHFNLISKNFTIPSDINAIIISRIDRLSANLKNVVKTASILGREFAINVLSKMLHNNNVTNLLLSGEKETIWNKLTELTYIFHHALIREAVYEMQLKQQLRKLHELAANSIEEIYKENLESHYSELANHFDKAENLQKAIEYLEKTANQAKLNYQNSYAIDTYDRLLDMIGDSPKYIEMKMDALHHKARIFDFIGKKDEAKIIFLQVLSLAKTKKDKYRICNIYNSIGIQLQANNKFQEALNNFQDYLRISEEIDDQTGISHALGNIALCHIGTKNFELATKFTEKKLAFCKEIDDKAGIAFSYSNLGIINLDMSNYDDAMKYFETQLKICNELNDVRNASIAYLNIGVIYTYKNDYKKGMEFFKKRLKTCEEMGERNSISVVIGNIGSIHYYLNEYDEAMKCFESQLNINKELDNQRGIAKAIGNMGNIYRIRKDIIKTKECYHKSIEIAESVNDVLGMSVALGNLGNAYKDEFNFVKATECYKKKLDLAKNSQNNRGIIFALRQLGNILVNQKKYIEALSFFNEVIEIDDRLNLKTYFIEDLSYKINCLLELKKYDEAKQNIELGIPIAEEMKNSDFLNLFQIFEKKAQFYLTSNSNKQTAIIEDLKKKVTEMDDDELIGLIHFELACMNKFLSKFDDMKFHKSESITYYTKLYTKFTDLDFKLKLDELDKI